MSQKHVLNDAHFPLWFTTLENVVEESRHCLSHSAALSHNICNTATAAQGFFTGVKCIWQCNRPLGYIYFPAKESAHLQVKRVVNAHNTESYAFGWRLWESTVGSKSLPERPAVSTFWPQRTATPFLLETVLVAASKSAVSQRSVSRGALK